MAVSPFDSALLGPLLGDEEIATLFKDEATLAAMVEVERALARAQGRLGIIPPEAAAAIDAGIAGLQVDPASIAAGTARAGVPVPALLAALRAALPPETARWAHWGATSQDIVDTGLALRLDRAIGIFAGRLDRLLMVLDAAAERWQDLPMAGRTRSQIAAPIAFGARCAAWAQPFRDLRAEIGAQRGRVARVQLGGSVGSNAVLAGRGADVSAALAAELNLADALSWHTNRTAFSAFGGWCTALTTAAGKMAGDLVLMGRSESREATAGAGGGSSTMPQKANPVAAETVVALARYAAILSSAMQLASLHAEERDGSAWTLEWLTLPQLVVCAGAALRHILVLADNMVPDPTRLRAVLDLDGGAAMAEAATFYLARRKPRAEAERIVKEALELAQASEMRLHDALTRSVPEIDWATVIDPKSHLGTAGRCKTFGRGGKVLE